MSEIPFVNLLGDALDEAVAPHYAPRPRRSRPRRPFLMAGLAALAISGGAVAVARLAGDSERLATQSVACYHGATTRGGVTVDWAGSRSPLAVCAKALGVRQTALVACDAGGALAVVRGRGASVCTRAGMKPLPAAYERAAARVAALERALLTIQSSADCIAPRDLARRVQALLDRSGWVDWRTLIRTDASSGPCGAVLRPGGGPRLTLAGALDAESHTVMVVSGPSRSLEGLLVGTESRPGASVWLVDATGERCFSASELRDYVRARLAFTRRAITFHTEPPLPPDSGIAGPRGRRYEAGCAVLNLSVARDGRGIVASVMQKP